MKKSISVIIFLCLIGIVGATNYWNIDINASKAIINEFNPNFINPNLPEGQPILFTGSLSIKTSVDTGSEYEIQLAMLWNNIEVFDTILIPNETTVNNSPRLILFNNHDLINSNSSRYFRYKSGNELDIHSILYRVSEINDFVKEHGRFPDGNYRFIIAIKSNGALVDSDECFFIVRGNQEIKLLYPGEPLIDEEIVDVSDIQRFQWNTSPQNSEFTIEIREYDEQYELNPSSIAYNGRRVEYVDLDRHSPTIYQADYNFIDGKYYAWRVISRLESIERDNNMSQFNVFRYNSLANIQQNNLHNKKMINVLYNLNIREITNLLNSGFNIEDGIEVDGLTYRGDSAVKKLQDLYFFDIIELSED